jgi:hypothetical protein
VIGMQSPSPLALLWVGGRPTAPNGRSGINYIGNALYRSRRFHDKESLGLPRYAIAVQRTGVLKITAMNALDRASL